MAQLVTDATFINASAMLDESQIQKRRDLKAAMVARGCEDMEPLRVAIEAATEANLDLGEIKEAQKILSKLEAETQPLTFTDVPRADMEVMQASTSREEVVAKLAKLMRLSKEDGLKAEVLADFHFHNFMFCQRSGFCSEKASALLSIMRALHSNAIVKQKAKQEQARALLEKLLQRHSRQLPPFSVGIYTKKEADAIREYANRTFFRHYSMFASMYEQPLDIVLRKVEPGVVPHVPPPVEFHVSHELDPHEVPELQDLFQPKAAAEEDEEATLRSKSEAKTLKPKSKREATLLEIIDEAMRAQLRDIDAKFALPNV